MPLIDAIRTDAAGAINDLSPALTRSRPSTGVCTAGTTPPLSMVITAEGRASVYFDANETDGLGTDIKGGSLGLVGWTEKAY